jgi:hypothetical protein
MADSDLKLSQLPAVASVLPADILALVQDGVTSRATIDQVKATVTAGFLPLAGGTLTGPLTLAGDPTADLHAASKRWVENRAFKDSARVATTAALTVTATTQTLTNNSGLAALQIDSVNLAVGNRVLVKNQASSGQNGLYVVTTVGSGSVAWVLTRVPGMDSWADVPGAVVTVEEGTTNSQTVWMTSATGSAGTLGTSAMGWVLAVSKWLTNVNLLTNNGLVTKNGNSAGQVFYSTANTANYLVQRDAAGAIGPLLKDYRLTAFDMATGSSIDTSFGNYFYKTISGNTAFTFSTSAASGTEATGFVLELTNGGLATVTWPTSVKWPGGAAPTLTAAGVDVLAFVTDDAGLNWRGVMSMKDSK